MRREQGTKRVEVSFPDGRVALTAFWGYLARGGLVLFGQRDLFEGEPIALNVHIGSPESNAEVRGVVMKSEPSGPTVVAFADAGASGSFLRAAFAGRPMDRDCPVVDVDRGGAFHARLVSLGQPGCTLAMSGDDADALPIGARVLLRLSGGETSGDVVWARGRERGILFDDDAAVHTAVEQTLAGSPAGS